MNIPDWTSSDSGQCRCLSTKTKDYCKHAWPSKMIILVNPKDPNSLNSGEGFLNRKSVYIITDSPLSVAPIILIRKTANGSEK